MKLKDGVTIQEKPQKWIVTINLTGVKLQANIEKSLCPDLMTLECYLKDNFSMLFEEKK